MGLGQGPGRDHLKPLETGTAFAAYEAARHRLPPAGRAGACERAGSLDDIANLFDVFLLDAFGVLNIGEAAIPGVPERIAALAAAAPLRVWHGISTIPWSKSQTVPIVF